MATRVSPTSLVVIALLVAMSPSRAQQPPAPPTPAAHDSVPAGPPSALIGRVTSSTGVVLAGAEISLLRSDKVHSITDDSGRFHIAALPPGTNVFNVRRLGFEPATFTAVLKPGKTSRATFTLTETAHELATVSVSDTATKTHWLDSFESRRSMHHGTFITRDDIVRSMARTGIDVVRSVPGVRIAPTRTGFQVIMNRGSGVHPCVPTMFYHNTPYSGTLEDFNADDIEALEVYVGISEIPAEFDKNGKGICGVIVVWTRDPRKTP